MYRAKLGYIYIYIYIKLTKKKKGKKEIKDQNGWRTNAFSVIKMDSFLTSTKNA